MALEVTLTLMSARTDGDDPDGDGPRVADTNHKQRQHAHSHKREAALGVVEQQNPTEYKEPVGRKWKTRVRDQVIPFVVTLLISN